MKNIKEIILLSIPGIILLYFFVPIILGWVSPEDDIRPKYKEGKWGVYNYAYDELLIDYKYDNVEIPYFNDKYLVEINGKKGVINHKGKELIQCKYDKISIDEIETDNERFSIVFIKGLIGVVDSIGHELIKPGKYSQIRVSYDLFRDYDGESVIYEPKFIAYHNDTIYNDFEVTDVIRKITYFSRNGEVFIPLSKMIYPIEGNKFFIVVSDNDNYYVVNHKGKKISSNYDWVHYRKGEEIFEVSIKSDSLNRKYGLFDKDFKELVPVMYRKIYRQEEGIVLYQLGNKYGFFDTKGMAINEVEYDFAHDFSEGFASVKLNKKWSFIGFNGEEVIKYKYDSIGKFKDGRSVVKLNNMYGMISTKGIEVAPLIYEDVSSVVLEENSLE